MTDPGDQNVHQTPEPAPHCPETLDLFAPLVPFQRHSPTSYEAAMKIAGKAGTLRRQVYECLLDQGPSTDRELQLYLGMAGSTQRPRRVRLVELDLVRDSGRKRTHEGRAATLWEVVE